MSDKEIPYQARLAAQRIVTGENPNFVWQQTQDGYLSLTVDATKHLVDDVKNEHLVSALETAVSIGAFTLTEQKASGAFLISYPKPEDTNHFTIRITPQYQQYLQEYFKTRGSRSVI